MDKYIIITEIQNMYINPGVSICIEGPKKEFYFYSNKFIEKLRAINEIIKKIKLNDLPSSHSLSGHEFIKLKESSTFIIFEQELNISLNAKGLLKYVENLMNPLINLFSLFLRNFFNIKRIYFFKKKNYGYEFYRLIDVNNVNKEVSDEPQLIQILYVDGVETVFPWLLQRMYRKKEYIPLIFEYLTGRVKAPNIEMKFMLYWNALEHFSHYFWINKGKSKFISKTKLKEFNDCVKEKIKSIEQDDILFPNITLKDLKKKGYLRVSSRPPIKEQVFSLIKRIRIDKPLKDVKDLINKIYYIRNRLFHAKYYLEDILEGFREKFNCPDFNMDDFTTLLKKFELFFEYLILKHLKIIPNYFDYRISKRWKNFHFLEWKKFRLPSYLRKIEIEKSKIDNRFKQKYDNRREYELNSFLYDKEEQLRKGKYLSIVKFISKFSQRIKEYTQNNFFIGFTNTRTGFSEIQIKFKDNLSGSFRIQNSERHTHFTDGYIIGESPVVSKISIKGSNYELRYDFSTIRYFPIDLLVEYERINGVFKTLIRDIRKVC